MTKGYFCQVFSRNVICFQQRKRSSIYEYYYTTTLFFCQKKAKPNGLRKNQKKEIIRPSKRSKKERSSFSRAETLHSVNDESLKTIQCFKAVFCQPVSNDCFILTYYSRFFQLFPLIMQNYALSCVVMHCA